jgi:hypothetical protein
LNVKASTIHSLLASIIMATSKLACWIPILGSGVGIATILALYGVAALYLQNLPPGVKTPPISLLACQTEFQHRLYQVGFSLTGVLLGYSVLVLFQPNFYPSIRMHSTVLALASLIGGVLAVVGVMGQGMVTLQLEFLQNIKGTSRRPSDGGDPLLPPPVGMTPQDILHQRLALVFFLGAALHTYSTCWYAHRGDGRVVVAEPSKTDASQRYSRRVFSTSSRRIKTACVVISLLAAPIAEWYHPTRQLQMQRGPHNEPMDNKRLVNVIGLAQYLAVGAYIVFFGSYSLDLWRIRRLETIQTANDNKQD